MVIEMYVSLSETRELMLKAHEGQFDKGGFPYHTHPDRVLARLIEKFPDATEHEKKLALLHDVIEDTEIDEEYLIAFGFEKELVGDLSFLSRNRAPSKMTYMEWIRYLTTKGQSVIRVKICDNEDNNDPERIKQLHEADRSISKRYDRAHEILSAAL